VRNEAHAKNNNMNLTFEQVQEKAKAGEIRLPKVNFEGKDISFIKYQIATHYYNLGLMALGMKCRNITFTQIKNYYGLKGKSAKDCLPQLAEILQHYKSI
jgi:hypothetical protein